MKKKKNSMKYCRKLSFFLISTFEKQIFSFRIKMNQYLDDKGKSKFVLFISFIHISRRIKNVEF